MPWTPRVALALMIGPSPVDPISDAELAAAWAEHGSRLLGGPGVPWAAWRFAPGIPDELREEPPSLYPEADADRVRAERAALQEQRRVWLAAS